MAYESSNPFVVADAAPSARAQFYRRTYAHVAGAFAVWLVAIASIFAAGAAIPLSKLMLGTQYSWLMVIGAFMAVRWVGDSMAFSQSSKVVQYSGLLLTVLGYAVIFVPLITLAALQCPGGLAEATSSILLPAGVTTATLIVGLTATVFFTNTDFSFMRTALTIGGFVSLGLIIGATLFGISLGFWFAAAMALFMAACILYQTHQIKTTLAPHQYIGAAVVLFSAFMTLLWYVIQLFMSRSRD